MLWFDYTLALIFPYIFWTFVTWRICKSSPPLSASLYLFTVPHANLSTRLQVFQYWSSSYVTVAVYCLTEVSVCAPSLSHLLYLHCPAWWVGTRLIQHQGWFLQDVSGHLAEGGKCEVEHGRIYLEKWRCYWKADIKDEWQVNSLVSVSSLGTKGIWANTNQTRRWTPCSHAHDSLNTVVELGTGQFRG